MQPGAEGQPTAQPKDVSHIGIGFQIGSEVAAIGVPGRMGIALHHFLVSRLMPVPTRASSTRWLNTTPPYTFMLRRMLSG